jgi:hypothetical protein
MKRSMALLVFALLFGAPSVSADSHCDKKSCADSRCTCESSCGKKEGKECTCENCECDCCKADKEGDNSEE